MPTQDISFRDLDREILRSAFVSLFSQILGFKKITFKALSQKLGINKSSPTRWFSESRPNWTVNTISDIADALNVDIEICARDRETGMIFTTQGTLRDGQPSAVPQEAKSEATNDGTTIINDQDGSSVVEASAANPTREEAIVD